MGITLPSKLSNPILKNHFLFSTENAMMNKPAGVFRFPKMKLMAVEGTTLVEIEQKIL